MKALALVLALAVSAAIGCEASSPLEPSFGDSGNEVHLTPAEECSPNHMPC